MGEFPHRLAAVLRAVSVEDALCSQAELRSPWGIALPAWPGRILYHLVLEGRAWVQVGDEGCWVERDEFILLPHGTGHVVSDGPDTPATDLSATDRQPVNARYELLRHGGDGALSRLNCGVCRLENPIAARFLRSLPALVRMRDPDEETRRLIHLAFDQSRRDRFGSAEIAGRLMDVLILRALQSCIEERARTHAGWLGALADDRIGEALTAIHLHPERRWSVAELAGLAGMSRSGFSAEFARLVGEPAITYLTRWRMECAASRLTRGDETIEALASEFGYDSAAAFSHAFKRHAEIAPGAFRRSRELAERPLL